MQCEWSYVLHLIHTGYSADIINIPKWSYQTNEVGVECKTRTPSKEDRYK